VNNLAEVYLWGTCIGDLYLRDDSSYAQFEYRKDFVEQVEGTGIQVAPIMMPVSNKVYSFGGLADSFHGVPGMIADSLPDKYGNAVINHWLTTRGISEAEFNVIDRLRYTGTRGMGALEYRPALGPNASENEIVNVSEMVRFASDVLNRRDEIKIDMQDATYSQLLKLGTSAGGARAKAVIAWNESTNEVKSGQTNPEPGFDYWLMKFDGVSQNGDHNLEDEPEYTLIEYAYYLMACEAGIDMSECRLFTENGKHHFMTKRFDRLNGGKLHMQTLAALAHIDYNTPRLCSYEMAASYMKKIDIRQKSMEQFYRRMVFNVLAVNRDDHVKNISFLMDRNGEWSLSPAYDVTFSYNATNTWLRAHQMLINNKMENINIEDLISCGKAMGLGRVKCVSILEEVKAAVNEFADIAANVGVRAQTIDAINKTVKELVSI
jgi:serine/threonine-protein kinase HipA